ncbi:hypothetical protein AV274_6196 [Blastocystis sp. ATCC 50177/Nand II]|uniref:Matrin-type domain-containing protein n=1 Tax=Blastocystis sp. subtype 1 (strain ATCC 50177 / NandII) TaxID=478820 RepID=A0A196S708_BLAHN|nr:hypothetical protein AV274_6196 [Blastocystis sp. ATCC 50177/Nand II]
MSSYWSSLPRYYCKYCNYWCVDNKINRQRHESSEQHQQNVEKYLARQKSAKERVAAQEKEVNRVLKQAEDDALNAMLNNNEIKDIRTLDALGGRKKTQKRKAFLFDDMPPIRIHYDTFGSWKTVSVTQVSEADLQKREEQYEKAVMKSNKEEKKKGKGKKKATEKPKKEEDEDEDEKDAFDMYNPFGGSYKGVNLSLDEPMYIPEKKALKPKVEEVKVEEKKEEKVDQPFISTPISFSFSPKPSSTSQKPAAPVSKSLSAFFS